MKVLQIFIRPKQIGILVFSGIEEGRGKNRNNVYAYYKAGVINEARNWIRIWYRKEFTIQ